MLTVRGVFQDMTWHCRLHSTSGLAKTWRDIWGKVGITCPVSNYFSQLTIWQENEEVFPMENFPREILSASFLFPEDYKLVQSPQVV